MIWFFNRFKSLSRGTSLFVVGWLISSGIFHAIVSDPLPDVPAVQASSPAIVATQPKATQAVSAPASAVFQPPAVVNTASDKSKTTTTASVAQPMTQVVSASTNAASKTSTQTQVQPAQAGAQAVATTAVVTTGQATASTAPSDNVFSGIEERAVYKTDPSKNGWYREFPDQAEKGDLLFLVNGEEKNRAGWNWENPNDTPGPSGDMVLRHPGFGKPTDKNYVAPGTIIDRKGWYRLNVDKDGLFIGRAWENGMSPMAVAQARFTCTILFPILAGGFLIGLAAFAAHQMNPGTMKERFGVANMETMNVFKGGEFGSVGKVISDKDGSQLRDGVFRFLRSRGITGSPEDSQGGDSAKQHLIRAAAILLSIQSRIAKATGKLNDASPVSEAIVRRQYLTQMLPDELRELADILHRNTGDDGFAGPLLARLGIVEDASNQEAVNAAIGRISGLGRRMAGEESFGVEGGLAKLPPYKTGELAADFKPVAEGESAALVRRVMTDEANRQRLRNNGLTNEAIDSADQVVRNNQKYLSAILRAQTNGLEAMRKRAAETESDSEQKVLKKRIEVCQDVLKLIGQANAIDEGTAAGAVAKARILQVIKDRLGQLPPDDVADLDDGGMIGHLRQLKKELESQGSGELFKSVDDEIEALRKKGRSVGAQEGALLRVVESAESDANASKVSAKSVDEDVAKARQKQQRAADQAQQEEQARIGQQGQLGVGFYPGQAQAMHQQRQGALALGYPATDEDPELADAQRQAKLSRASQQQALADAAQAQAQAARSKALADVEEANARRAKALADQEQANAKALAARQKQAALQAAQAAQAAAGSATSARARALRPSASLPDLTQSSTTFTASRRQQPISDDSQGPVQRQQKKR